MPRLPLRTIADAPDETKGALTAAEQNNGFLPNLLRILANAPVALESYLTVSGINARSSLALAEREAVQITAAAVHGCGFCVAGHTAIAAKKAQMEPSVIAALRSRTAVDTPRINAVARFTEAVIASRSAVPDDALAAFKRAGFDDPAALEVVLGVSLATLCNLGQLPLNEPLARGQPVQRHSRRGVKERGMTSNGRDNTLSGRGQRRLVLIPSTATAVASLPNDVASRLGVLRQ